MMATASAEAVSAGLTAAGLGRADAAQGGERGVAVQPLRVATGGDEQLGSAVDPDARALEQAGSGQAYLRPNHGIELEDLLLQAGASAGEVAGDETSECVSEVAAVASKLGWCSCGQ